MLPLSQILPAYHHLHWAQANSILDFALFATEKLPIFWAHTDSPKPKTLRGNIGYLV